MATAILNAARVCGIYKFTNAANGKFYVGSSIRMKERWAQHLSKLRRGAHCNAHLQSAFRRYGEGAFSFELLEQCAEVDMVMREQHYIDTLRPEYNICMVAGVTLGYRHTAEALAKMAQNNKGRPGSFTGRNHTAETRQRISDKQKSRRLTPEHAERLRQLAVGNKNTAGKKMPDGHAEKRRAVMLALWSDPVWKAQRLERQRAARQP